jgi:hypothetical protein
MKRRSIAVGLLLGVSCIGCAAPVPEQPPKHTISATLPNAGETPAEPRLEGAIPTKGPLADLAKALEEVETEAERGRALGERLEASEKEAARLKSALAEQIAAYSAVEERVQEIEAEHSQLMARLVDSELARVRAEQELLRRQIEVEEQSRLDREETQ